MDLHVHQERMSAEGANIHVYNICIHVHVHVHYQALFGKLHNIVYMHIYACTHNIMTDCEGRVQPQYALPIHR